MQKIQCPICHQEGVLQWKETVTTVKGKRYSYKKLYVYHQHPKEHPNKPKWCYLSKEQVKSITQKESTITQNITQNKEAQKMLKSKKESTNNRDCPGSIVRSSISGCRPLDPGSNPGQGAIIVLFQKAYELVLTKF